jgi:hypothetical protein
VHDVNSAPLFAFAHPVFAWIGIFLAAALIYGLVKRLFKIAVFFGIAAAVAWVVFFAG